MTSIRIFGIHTILFICLIASSLKAQISSFRNINNGDGLIDWQVNCFFKDAEGFIWTGGTFLVQRFDGRYIKIYNLPKEVNKVYAINETHDGVIYVATSNGLYTITRNSSIVKRIYSSKITKNVFSIVIDSKENIYVGTQDGLIIISKGGLKMIQTQNMTFPYNQILSIHQATDGILWLLTPGGIVSFNPSTETKLTYPSLTTTANSYFTCMTAVGHTLYIGTDKSGIYTFNTLNGNLDKFMNVGNGSITCLITNGKSQLYAGSAGSGIFFIAIADKKIFKKLDSSPNSSTKLTSSMITTLMIDNLGILWVGNSENLGFDYMFLHPKTFILYKTPTFTTNNLPIHGFYVGEDFKLLTNRYGIYYVSEKNGNTQFFETGTGKAKYLRPGDVLTFIPYNKKIILGGECGIYSFDPGEISLKVFEPLSFLNKATIYHLTKDIKGNLWIASSTGLYVLNKITQQVKTYNTLNSNLPDNVVRFIYFDRRDRIWICTDKGICFWDEKRGKFTPGKFPSGFINKQKVHFMMEDQKGNILFLYDIKKAFHTDPTLKKFKNICTEKDSDFTGIRLNKILQDRFGSFWFIGSRGTIKANEALTKYELYSTTEGLMEPYTTDGHFDPYGKLWLSNNKGLYYSSGSLKRSIATMAVSDIRINGVSEINEMYDAIKKGDRIKFSRYKNNIEFQFALLSYDKPDLMIYECKLKGIDTSWRILRGLNNIDYKNLSPGQYTFTVRRNMDHTCFKEINFEIKPLLSNLEIIIILLFFVGTGWTFYHYKLKNSNTKTIKSQLEKVIEAGQKYKFNKINKKEADEIIRKLKQCMEEKKLYLNENLRMLDLANEVGYSSQTLSQVFNIFMNESYYDFINRYRIDEFKYIIVHTEYSKFTLKTIAKKCGFSSYTSFFRAFKNQTGVTPNEFIQNSGLKK